MLENPSTDTFAGLMLSLRGRSGLTQRQLAARVGVNLRSIQAWETGESFPSTASLQLLIGAYLDEHAFALGREVIEAEALWAAALEESPRLRPPFERAWFDDLIARRNAAGTHLNEAIRSLSATRVQTTLVTAGTRAHDWGEAPDDTDFVGRGNDLATLTDWLLDVGCHMVGVLGAGGVGKTRLAARLARDVAAEFEYVYWRSVRNAPTANEWLGGAISMLSEQSLVPPQGQGERLTAFLALLRAHRCLLILDNFETLLEPGRTDGRYRSDVGPYDAILRAVGQSDHQSCLMVTSREAPAELAELAGDEARVRTFEVRGLGSPETQALLRDKALRGTESDWDSLTQVEGGNCLALRVVGQTIQQIFGGDIAAFLQEAPANRGFVYGGIRRLLDSQLSRLAPLEREVLEWLAVERDPVTFANLAIDHDRPGRGEMMEVIDSLLRRSLVERVEPRAFTLQSVVLEHVTDALVQTVADEIENAATRVLISHPLMKAQAKDFVRRTQERLILAPVLERLVRRFGSPQAAENRLLELTRQLRRIPQTEHGYAAGNFANLLRLLRGNLNGVDLSDLGLRQVDLRDCEMQDASLASADISGCVLADAFGSPPCVALSGDGTLVAAGTFMGEVYLWRVRDRALRATFRAHTGMTLSVALSDNGDRLASSSDDGTVNLWNTQHSRLITTLSGHAGGALAVALSADGRLVASGDALGAVRIWSADDGVLLSSAPGKGEAIWGLSFDSEARILSSASGSTVQVWEVPSCRLIGTLEGHNGGNFCAATSGDGRIVASGSFDGNVRAWQVENQELIATMSGHASGAWSVGLNEDGHLLVSGSFDGTVRSWDALQGRLIATMPGHTGGVRGVSVSRDGQLMASASYDGSVRLWQADGRLVSVLKGYSSAFRSVALSGDGRWCATASYDGTARLWSIDDTRLVQTWSGHTGGVWAVAMSPDGQLVASAGDDGTLRVWRAAAEQPVAVLPGHTGAVWSVALSQDGREVVSGSLDGTVRIWSSDAADCIAVLDAGTGPVWAVARSRDGLLLASAGAGGSVTLWDHSARTPRLTYQAHASPVWSLALSSDAQLLASASFDATVRLWNTATGECIGSLTGHTGGVWCVAMSGDGQTLASAGFDGTVRLWNARTLQPLHVFSGHTAGVWGVAFDEQGGRLVSAGADGTVAVWDIASGRLLDTLRRDRIYERLDISGLSGVTEAQRGALFALGAVTHAAL